MTEHVRIQDGRFVYGEVDYGPSDHILAYPGEEVHLGTLDGVTHGHRTPADIDLIFSVGKKVVGAEVKLPSDLIGSWYIRRLQRQLRTLRACVDIQMLVLRGQTNVDYLADLFYDYTQHIPISKRRNFESFLEDMINIQTQGVYIVSVPEEGYLHHLYTYRRAFTTQGYRALAGTDQVMRERKSGWLLRRIPGIGPKHSAALVKAYKSSWGVFKAAKAGKLTGALARNILKALED